MLRNLQIFDIKRVRKRMCLAPRFGPLGDSCQVVGKPYLTLPAEDGLPSNRAALRGSRLSSAFATMRTGLAFVSRAWLTGDTEVEVRRASGLGTRSHRAQSKPRVVKPKPYLRPAMKWFFIFPIREPLTSPRAPLHSQVSLTFGWTTKSTLYEGRAPVTKAMHLRPAMKW